MRANAEKQNTKLEQITAGCRSEIIEVYELREAMQVASESAKKELQQLRLGQESHLQVCTEDNLSVDPAVTLSESLTYCAA